ncbi:PQQ-like beta-propeller repeat protein [Brevibacterium zhoupengii]|uniref:PQQ-like beta-propeller repeat protein n=1 Tax=Brevibacterium zhoupengii TaxID=2898795 RepID=UPI001F089899|nr:PQQ-like beta-propeller repeat protein [Brevibacterium zhoupengii]
MQRRSIASAALPLALAVALPLSACSGPDQNPQSREPSPAGSHAPSFEPAGAETDSAPQSTGNNSAAARTVDPGWDAPAQEAGGTFLSMHENDDSLEYRAVDSSGEVLWTAQRPRACSAYLVTTTDDGPIAVLMDQGPTTGNSLTPTASGYDLETGKKRWGPVETPGAMLGNGLVFAGAPKDFIGTGGPRTALNPATGDVAAAESEDAADNEDGTSSRVVALFGQHLLRSQNGDIVGEDLDGNRLWTRAAEDLGVSASEVREIPWEPIGASHALLGDAGSAERTLVDLDSGASVDSDISGAWFDSASDTVVTAGPDLQGFNSDGTERWRSPLPESAEVAAMGAGLIVFASESDGGAAGDGGTAGDGTAARSARDGKKAEGDTALLATFKRLGSPHHISESGAALVGDPQTPLLITGRS